MQKVYIYKINSVIHLKKKNKYEKSNLSSTAGYGNHAGRMQSGRECRYPFGQQDSQFHPCGERWSRHPCGDRTSGEANPLHHGSVRRHHLGRCRTSHTGGTNREHLRRDIERRTGLHHPFLGRLWHSKGFGQRIRCFQAA